MSNGKGENARRIPNKARGLVRVRTKETTKDVKRVHQERGGLVSAPP